MDENKVCKVADFGFARDVIASHVYERKSEVRLLSNIDFFNCELFISLNTRKKNVKTK